MSGSNLKILMVIGQYFPIIGGSENQAKKLSEKLYALGNEVSVLTIKQKHTKKQETINGISVIRKTGFLYKRIKTYTANIMIFLYVLRHGKKFDVIHVHQAVLPAFFATAAAKIIGKPTLVKIAGSGEVGFDLYRVRRWYLLGSWFQKSIIKNTDKFISVTPAMKNDFKTLEIEENKIRVIPNGVEVPDNNFENNGLRKELAISENTVVGIFLAKMRVEKNHLFLLNALAKLPQDLDFKIVFVGAGPEYKAVKNKSDELNLSEKVVFIGTVNDPSPYLEISDFGLLPSSREGLSNALLEMMAYGIAPLVSDIPANQAVVPPKKNKNILIPLQEQDWANSIEKIVKESSYRKDIQSTCKEHIEEHYSIQSVSQKYLNLYSELIANEA